jgi:AraC-like DNA-binding protein
MTRTDKTLSKSDIIHSPKVVKAEKPVAAAGRRSDIELVETDIRSPTSETLAVRSSSNDSRPWMVAAPQCDLLSQYQILHLGIAKMPDPFRIVRTHLGGSYFLASLSGEGRVLVDGKWVPSCPGQAFLLPPKTMHAFYTPKGKEWHFCWVRYQEVKGQLPIARANSPVLAKFDTGPFEHAIRGLRAEALGAATPAQLDLWMRLIHGYIQAFAQPVELDDRLWQTWEQVAAKPAHPWTIAELARRTHLSEKQFQRLCRRELGRSPQQQLMWLRMRRASELLATGTMKIHQVAAAVGYQNPFVFSSTFKRILGWSPSEYPSANASHH